MKLVNNCLICSPKINELDNHKAGICSCDDLISQEKEPCPQCKKGLVRNTGSSCEIIGGTCDPKN